MSAAEELKSDDPEVKTAVAKIEKMPIRAQGAVMAIMPRDIDEAYRYASGLVAANIIPDAFRNGGKRDGEPNQALIMMGVLKSMELGVPPQTGLAGLLPINGRFSVWGDLATALALNTGKITKQSVTEMGAEGFDEGQPIGLWPDAYGFSVCYWRENQETPFVGKFTVRDAKRAGLWNNASRKPWVMYPKRMLFNRARAFALRDGFADGLNGLSIAEEVLDTLPPPTEERGTSKRLTSLIDEAPETEGKSDETEA